MASRNDQAVAANPTNKLGNSINYVISDFDFGTTLGPGHIFQHTLI